jgi:hypothetical protein
VANKATWMTNGYFGENWECIFSVAEGQVIVAMQAIFRLP